MEKEYKISWPKVIGIFVSIVVIIGILFIIYPNNKCNASTVSNFASNISLMKEAGFVYFDESKLPEKIGEKSVVSLGNLLEEDLIEEFVDENGKSCNVDESYIEATKTVDNEYAMKVYLSCENNTDYIVTTISDDTICTDCDTKSDNSAFENTKNTTTTNTVYSKKLNDYTSTPVSSNKITTSTKTKTPSKTTTGTKTVTTKTYKTVTNIINYNINYFNSCGYCISNNCMSSCLSNVYYTVHFVDGGDYIGKQTVKQYDTATYISIFKSGYEFLGWYLEGEKYNFNTQVTRSITLVAKWKKIVEEPSINKYIVTFNSNGGTYVDYQEVEEYNRAFKPADPTKDCYDFAGWYTDKSLTKRYSFSSPVTKDITLYAKWVENDSCTIEENEYTVRFNSNGGTKVADQIVFEYDTVNRPEDPTKECYDFAGWYTTSSLKTKYNFNTPVTKDMTLYAKWVENDSCIIEENEYTVKFNSNGGTKVASQTVVEYNRAYEPVDPTRNGYTFVGWYTTSSLRTKYNFNTPVTKDITLYAKWEKDEVKYNTYCKVEDETYYSISHTTYRENGGTYSYNWKIKFDKLHNVDNLRITDIGYLTSSSMYTKAYNKYVTNSGISKVNGNTNYNVTLKSASILRNYSLKSNNFTKTLSNAYYSGGYWYTNASVTVRNYNNASKYYADNLGYYIYFVPFYFNISYTDMDNCVDDLASNSSRYRNYEIVDTYYE